MLRFPILRTPESIAQLWLCQDFIPAFHFIHGYDHGTQLDRFRKIIKGGYLKPAAQVGTASMFVLDVLAGDDQYVYLSPLRPAMGMGGGTDFGFVFDAAELLHAGALYNDHDLLHDYERAVIDVAQEVGAFSKWTAESLAVEGRQKNTPENIERFYNYKSNHGVAARDFADHIIAAIHHIQHKYRLSGNKAIEWLTLWSDVHCKLTNDMLEYAKAHVSNQSEPYLQWLDTSSSCAEAIRNTVAQLEGRLHYNLAAATNPEIIWRGGLPLEFVKYGFALPKPKTGRLYTGIDWPDDLFRLACK